jgi:hypothetical protein
MAGQSQGAFARLSINGVFIETAVRFVDRSIYGLVDPGPEVFSGILDNPKEIVSAGIQTFAFQILLYPTVAQLDTILPLIGMAESPTDTFTLTDDFSALTFSVVVDKVAKVHTYTNCIIDKAIFRGQKGLKPISLELHVLARGLTEGSSFGSPTTPTLTAPYAFNVGTITNAGNTEVFDRFVLAVDNHAVVQHNNSETPTSIQPSWRSISLGTSMPYTSDEIAILTTAVGATRADGVAGTVAFARGNFSTTFTLANLKWQATPPSVLGKGQEIRMQSFWTAYKSGATSPLIITHDATA